MHLGITVYGALRPSEQHFFFYSRCHICSTEILIYTDLTAQLLHFFPVARILWTSPFTSPQKCFIRLWSGDCAAHWSKVISWKHLQTMTHYLARKSPRKKTVHCRYEGLHLVSNNVGCIYRSKHINTPSTGRQGFLSAFSQAPVCFLQYHVYIALQRWTPCPNYILDMGTLANVLAFSTLAFYYYSYYTFKRLRLA